MFVFEIEDRKEEAFQGKSMVSCMADDLAYSADGYNANPSLSAQRRTHIVEEMIK
jgi:hypothetical protein